MSQGNLPSSVGHQVESTKRNPAQVRFFESRAKTPLEWVEYFAKQSPGPGAYTASDDRPSTGKFSMARPMGYIDMCINRGKREPGPFDYPQPGLGDAGQRPGGKFSTAYVKSFIELECQRSNQIPGPKYKTPPAPVSGLFGKINEANPKSAVDWLVYAAASKPGPGEYAVKGKTRTDCNASRSGMRFGKGNPKNFIELEELRCSDHPAPDSYRINKLGVHAIRPKIKEPKRSFCSRDRLFSQLQALDQMSRKKRLTPADKKRRKEKKQRKKMENIRKRARERRTKQKFEENGGDHGRDPELIASDKRIALYSTKKLLQYKISKLDEVYRRYT